MTDMAKYNVFLRTNNFPRNFFYSLAFLNDRKRFAPRIKVWRFTVSNGRARPPCGWLREQWILKHFRHALGRLTVVGTLRILRASGCATTWRASSPRAAGRADRESSGARPSFHATALNYVNLCLLFCSNSHERACVAAFTPITSSARRLQRVLTGLAGSRAACPLSKSREHQAPAGALPDFGAAMP